MCGSHTFATDRCNVERRYVSISQMCECVYLNQDITHHITVVTRMGIVVGRIQFMQLFVGGTLVG